jgi:hypothetical protein
MERIKMTRVVSFRVTEEEWLAIERAAARNGETGSDWCRTIALETIRIPEALTPNQSLLFSHISQTWYLVWVGFQLLAEDKLDSEQYTHYREYAVSSIDAITNHVLENFRQKRSSNSNIPSGGN